MGKDASYTTELKTFDNVCAFFKIKNGDLKYNFDLVLVWSIY